MTVTNLDVKGKIEDKTGIVFS